MDKVIKVRRSPVILPNGKVKRIGPKYVKLATAKGLINQPAEMLKYQIEDTQARYIVEEFFARNDEQAEKKLNDHIEGRRDVEYATAIDNGASEEEAAALAEEMDFYLNVSQVLDYETEVMGSADPRNA